MSYFSRHLAFLVVLQQVTMRSKTAAIYDEFRKFSSQF